MTRKNSSQMQMKSAWIGSAAIFCWTKKSVTHFLQMVLALIAGFLVTSVGMAQTSVTGAITTNTQWTLADAPYLVSGQVVVQNGAVLHIEPGVTIYMASDADLSLQSGSIRAEGTAANPIHVLSDKVRQGQMAVAGDWKHWTFAPGTTNTLLAHVIFEHGSGLIVQGSAPVFNGLQILHQAGAAIAIDLAASPSGSGNQASDNALNGILVPQGDITGNVQWGVEGIPYVVSGQVSVGVSPVVSSVTPDRLSQGETATFSITGSRLAGLAAARLDAPGVDIQVLPGATNTSATLSISATPEALTGVHDLRLWVDAGEIHVPDALEVVPSQPVVTGFSPASLYMGQGAVDLSIQGYNFTNQSTVLVGEEEIATQYLSSTQLVARIETPATAGNHRVRLKTPDPANPGAFFFSDEQWLTVIATQITIAPSLVSIFQDSGQILTVGLPYVAPPGGIGLNLVSSVPTVATTPASVTIPEGQSTATFQVNGVMAGNTVITVSKVGLLSGQAQVMVIVGVGDVITGVSSSGTLQEEYSAQLIFNGSAPYAWSILSGSLPPGLTLDAASGVVSGVPTTIGYYDFVVRVIDAEGVTVERPFSIGIGQRSLLMHFDGVDDGTVFPDATGKTVTPTGVVTKTDVVKMGTASGYFSGNSYLTVPNSADFDFSTQDFTIECWVYLRAWSGVSLYGTVISKRVSGIDHDWTIINNNSRFGMQYTQSGVVNWLDLGSHAPDHNAWTHLAVTRKGNILRGFRDGVLVSTATLTEALHNRATSISIGRSISYADSYLNGNLDELRITRGVARYTENFTVK
ncbi:MAG: putative Ig domain-containing protein [Candidatus Accumulibacter sp.]|jgi:hypothetical protein|nr:putative Ig domain-containing protein [Accumulibacter sp.]